MEQPVAETPPAAAEVPNAQAWFGHPRGLATLFFTELWERFSYYGMRGILILFMAAAVMEEGGLGFSDSKAAAIYGLYTSAVYLLALPGGWVADNLWGQRRAVFVGGCIIAAGHFSMALPIFGLPEHFFFYTGLILIVLGTGLLKPNVSTMVGELYPEGGARRDAGFSIFYMGINIGALAGPLICGWLGEGVNWHLGFSAAGFGMVFGLFQYKLGDRYLGEAGTLRSGEGAEVLSRRQRNFYLGAAGVAALLALFAVLATTGVIQTDLSTVAYWVGIGIILLTILYFAYLTLGWLGMFVVLAVGVAGMALGTWWRGSDFGSQVGVGAAMVLFLLLNLGQGLMAREKMTLEKRRLLVIFWLFLLAAVFWSGFEQAGSSMNLFADRLTNRTDGVPGLLIAAVNAVLGAAAWVVNGVVGLVSTWQWTPTDLLEMPASWLQSINPLFIIILAPVFGSLWVWLAKRNAHPSIPVKFGLGLLGLSAGFFVIAWGASQASAENPVTPAWLIVTYFLHTCGELALSPVGLSSITKLAPAGRVGQMMGVWFIGAALGNLFAGLVAGQLEQLQSESLFALVATIVGGVGVFALLVSPGVRKLMGHVE